MHYGERMKKDNDRKKEFYIFITNIIVILICTGVAVYFIPSMASHFLGFNETVASAFSPVEFVSAQENKTNSDNSEQTENNTNTTQKETQTTEATTVENIVNNGDIYSNITDVPQDIAKLMKKAEKNIKNEKKVGKTSEEDYFGGGTLVSHNGVEVQSRIPDSFYKLDIKSLLEQKAQLSIKDVSKPTVLVYHSHSTESYTLLDVGYYTTSLDLRTEDEAKNMVRVGDDLCAYLEKAGISVIHDRKIHDKSYNGAYVSSR